MAFRYALPALAIAGSAVAQCGSGSATTTIQNAGDASALASCQTYSGSIAIATGTTDDLDFGDLRAISGSLSCSEANDLSSISAAGLQRIGDAFKLENVQILSTLNFPQLSQVGSIEWTGLPTLSGLSFTTGLQEAESLTIINTGLQSLNGINLQSVDTFIVTNNNFLNEISMQVSSIANNLQLSANGREVTAEFPNLEWAANATLNNVTTLSMPSLSSVNGSFGLNSNFFESAAFPNLTNVGETLAFVANAQLTNISVPELKTIMGGLLIANNTKLEEIDFPSLSRVDGAIDVTGDFTSLKMPELNTVRGAVNLQSSADINSDVCDNFQNYKDDSTIRGKYTCKATSDPKTINEGGQSGSGTSSGSGSDTSGNAASTRYISGATGVLGVIAAIFGML